VIGRARHLQEHQLVECYRAGEHGEPIDPPAAEHLVDCDECGARYAELASLMDALRAEADVETDGIFTPERLAAQQQQIARRIEHIGRSARVISFPRPPVTRHMNASGPRGVIHWIYAAAAAGVVIGIGLGVAYESQWRALQSAHQSRAAIHRAGPSRPAHFVPAATSGDSPAPEASDDAFLSDLESALERPRTRELQPLDTLTPHVREVYDRVR